MKAVRTNGLRFLAMLVLAAPLSLLLAGCGGNGSPISIAGLAAAGATRQFVGAKTCETCHPTQYADERNSGHPYKLNKVVNGTPPTYPAHVQSQIPNPPAGYNWADISYVIGGYGWKARFIDKQGYIITGNAVQYNLQNQTWTAYHAADPVGTKPYNCGACHTTGWVATGAAGPHQDDLPGMYGTFTDQGVTCEACHGGGSVHIVSQSKTDINLGDGDTECANCHYRPDRGPIEVSGGFIRHHEQSEELNNGGHANLRCTDCHDPHKGPHYDNAQPGAIRRACFDCHQIMPNKHVAGPACEDCHMPKATKSAIKLTDHQGDVHTHIFSLNTNAVAASDANGMFAADGKTVDTSTGKARVTLDFACYGCHNDANSVGGGGSQKTLAELSAKATGIHN